MSAAKRSRCPRANSKSATKRSFNLLPEDLIVKVFLRLPKKSLLRFRRVSKSLCNSILSHNSVSDFSVMHIEAGRLFSMDFHLPDNLNSCAEKEVSFPHNNKPRFIGSCKGIVCLMISPAPTDSPALDSFILLNPFNRTYQKVRCSNDYQINRRNSIGFGYDCATEDDYKIVMLQPYQDCTIRYLQVYSMRRDSWRKHVNREFSPTCSPKVNGVCVEGAIHWKGLNSYSCIVAFDLETEVLRSLPLPHALIATRQPWSLHDLGGRLCSIVKFCGRTIVRVWVMEGYGVETS